MAAERVFLFAGGLSFIPLLFVSGGLQANAPEVAVPTVTETSAVGSSVTSTTAGQPVSATGAASPVTASSTAKPAAMTSTADSSPDGRTSAEPITGATGASTPPDPSPLAPLSAPSTNSPPEPAISAQGLTDTATQTAIAGAALAPPASARTANVSMPATPPPDLIDDTAPITQSLFDGDDALNHHPVRSAAPLTSSFFDQEDRTDQHPVP